MCAGDVTWSPGGCCHLGGGFVWADHKELVGCTGFLKGQEGSARSAVKHTPLPPDLTLHLPPDRKTLVPHSLEKKKNICIHFGIYKN